MGFPENPQAIDLMIAFPFKKAEIYAFLRAQAKDDETASGEGAMAMPAGYLFNEVGEDADDDEDVIETGIAHARPMNHHQPPHRRPITVATVKA